MGGQDIYTDLNTYWYTTIMMRNVHVMKQVYRQSIYTDWRQNIWPKIRVTLITNEYFFKDHINTDQKNQLQESPWHCVVSAKKL